MNYEHWCLKERYILIALQTRDVIESQVKEGLMLDLGFELA